MTNEGWGRTFLQVEVIGSLCWPQPHGVYGVVLETRHWCVIRHGQHDLQHRRTETCITDILGFPKTLPTVQRHSLACILNRTYLSVYPFGPTTSVLHSAIEMDRQHVLRTGLLPGVAIAQPIVCFLHLCGWEKHLLALSKKVREVKWYWALPTISQLTCQPLVIFWLKMPNSYRIP